LAWLLHDLRYRQVDCSDFEQAVQIMCTRSDNFLFINIPTAVIAEHDFGGHKLSVGFINITFVVSDCRWRNDTTRIAKNSDMQNL
jgi:hypothetical protein